MKLCPLPSDVFRGHRIECISDNSHAISVLDHGRSGVGRPNGDLAVKGYEVGDSIHGHRIIAEARKVSDPVVIVKSGRHKAQRIVLTENALAVIDRKGRVVRAMIATRLR